MKLIVFLTLILLPLTGYATEAKSDHFEEASVEELMKKKLKMFEEGQKINRIEAVVDEKIEVKDLEQIEEDKKQYKPLKENDSKLIQKDPPFKAHKREESPL